MMKQMPGMMGGKMGKRGELQASFLINVNTNKDIIMEENKNGSKNQIKKNGTEESTFL